MRPTAYRVKIGDVRMCKNAFKGSERLQSVGWYWCYNNTLEITYSGMFT